MISDDEPSEIRERFRELDALNDAENPDDDRDRFDKALRVRAWACAWDVEALLAEVDRLTGIVAANHDGAEHAEELLAKQATSIDRLRARVAELEAQRDKVLALCEEIECSNCGHAVKLHDASPTGECTQDHMKTRACGCDWSHPIADDIHAVCAEPATAETTADTFEEGLADWERELLEKQAQDEADLADINQRVAAEQNVLDKAKAWRAALPWHTGVPRDKYAERLADTQDALCTAVDALPANSHVAPTNSQTWEQAQERADEKGANRG